MLRARRVPATCSPPAAQTWVPGWVQPAPEGGRRGAFTQNNSPLCVQTLLRAYPLLYLICIASRCVLE